MEALHSRQAVRAAGGMAARPELALCVPRVEAVTSDDMAITSACVTRL